MKRVLVTGATGFVGRQTLGPLRDLGYEVHAVHNRGAPLALEGVTWHCTDLLEAELDVGASHLLHAAWYTAPGEFWDAEENLLWLDASLRLVRRFIAAG